MNTSDLLLLGGVAFLLLTGTGKVLLDSVLKGAVKDTIPPILGGTVPSDQFRFTSVRRIGRAHDGDSLPIIVGIDHVGPGGGQAFEVQAKATHSTFGFALGVNWSGSAQYTFGQDNAWKAYDLAVTMKKEPLATNPGGTYDIRVYIGTPSLIPPVGHALGQLGVVLQEGTFAEAFTW